MWIKWYFILGTPPLNVFFLQQLRWSHSCYLWFDNFTASNLAIFVLIFILAYCIGPNGRGKFLTIFGPYLTRPFVCERSSFESDRLIMYTAVLLIFNKLTPLNSRSVLLCVTLALAWHNYVSCLLWSNVMRTLALLQLEAVHCQVKCGICQIFRGWHLLCRKQE